MEVLDGCARKICSIIPLGDASFSRRISNVLRRNAYALASIEPRNTTERPDLLYLHGQTSVSLFTDHVTSHGNDGSIDKEQVSAINTLTSCFFNSSQRVRTACCLDG
jgi:hypothetical protein